MAATHSPTRVAVVFTCLAFAAPVAGNIERTIVRPLGRITTDDTVSLDIYIHTANQPATFTQPTEVTTDGNRITLAVYVTVGPLFSSDWIIDSVELGTFDPGSYEYEVRWGDSPYCPVERSARGTFCVEDPDCADSSCRCPVFCPSYIVTNLADPGQVGAPWLEAINNRGQIAARSLLWDVGTWTPLGGLAAGESSSGHDVNDAGQVIGTASLGFPLFSAFHWENGQMTPLPTLPGIEGQSTRAYAINDVGQIAGSADTSQYSRRAVLWRDGEIVDLADEYGLSLSSAWDINNAGQIIAGRWVLEPDGRITDLGTLEGWSVLAAAINDHGLVAGYSGDHATARYAAILWHDGEITNIGELGGFFSSEAVAINNSGQVLATAWYEDGGPLVYDRTRGIGLLRDMIRRDSDLWQIYPEDINDAGQIVGPGTKGYALVERRSASILMTPIAEDGCLCLRNFAGFQNCFAPEADIPDGCHHFDYRPDGRVDLGDHQDFADTFTAHLGP